MVCIYYFYEKQLSMNRIGDRIRKRREHLGIPLNVLAKGIGSSSSLLSQIENAKAFPSIHTLKHIADYLNTSVGSLIGENETFANNPVVKWTDRSFVKKNEAGATLYLMAHYSPLQTMEIYSLDFDPHGNSSELLENRKIGQEFCHVLKGNIEFLLVEGVHALSEGDSIYFFSQDLKLIKNATAQMGSVLWAISPLKL